MTFTILNETKACKTAYGNYSLNITDVDKEDFENMSLIMPHISKNVESITSVLIDDIKFTLRHFFGGDLKCLLSVFGIILF